MKCISIAAGLVVAGMALQPQAGLAEPKPQTQPALAPNPNIVIDYIDPRSAVSQATLKRLQQRRVLEEISQFLSPLRLPRVLRMRTKTCGQANAYYVPAEWAINLCYEYNEYLDGLATRATTTLGFTRGEVIVGGFVDAVFHELGHALFDIFQDSGLRTRGGCRRPDCRVRDAAVRQGSRAHHHQGRRFHLPEFGQSAHSHAVRRRARHRGCSASSTTSAWAMAAIRTRSGISSTAGCCRRSGPPTVLASIGRSRARSQDGHTARRPGLMKQVQSRQWLRPDELK